MRAPEIKTRVVLLSGLADLVWCRCNTRCFLVRGAVRSTAAVVCAATATSSLPGFFGADAAAVVTYQREGEEIYLLRLLFWW